MSGEKLPDLYEEESRSEVKQLEKKFDIVDKEIEGLLEYLDKKYADIQAEKEKQKVRKKLQEARSELDTIMKIVQRRATEIN